MSFHTKLMRLFGRANSTLILIVVVILITFVGFHVYQKSKTQLDSNEIVEPVDTKIDSSKIDSSKISKPEVPTPEGMIQFVFLNS